jgi:hypothetical protein
VSVALPESARDRAELRNSIARARLALPAARPEVASAGTGRSDRKGRRARSDSRPSAGAPPLPPLPLAPSREEELADATDRPADRHPVAPAPELELLEPAVRARAERMLAACGDPGEVAHVVRVALALERCR